MADSEENKTTNGNGVTRNIAMLRRKFGSSMHCPMCGGNQFSVVDGYVRNDIQNRLDSVQLGGPFIPTIMAICNNCGFVSQHALSVLDQDNQGKTNG